MMYSKKIRQASGLERVRSLKLSFLPTVRPYLLSFLLSLLPQASRKHALSRAWPLTDLAVPRWDPGRPLGDFGQILIDLWLIFYR